MSGIAGIIRLDDRPADPADLRQLGEAMARSGPDYREMWHADGVGLVHAALLTTPEAQHTRQPCSHNGQQRITAAVRLDNYDELRHILQVVDSSLHADISAAELILRAYERWGEACVDHLLGDFAFAIWDASRQTLFCARDHFGVCNFHYYLDTTAFVFATSVQAVLCLPWVNRAINEGRIADSLVEILELYDQTSTFYQHIHRLPKGHTLTLHQGSVTVQQYWRPELPPPIRYRRDEDYAAAFLEHFRVAVSARLRAPAPDQVASTLSGGSDSSSIVGVARDLYQQRGLIPFPTFSVVADDDQPDDVETRYINAVIAQGRLNATRVRISDLPDYLPDLAYVLDTATDVFDHRISVPELMCAAARRRGSRVLLAGSGGDEFASLTPEYPMYLARRGQIIQSFRETYGMARFYGLPLRSVIPQYMRHLYHAFVPIQVRRLRWRFSVDPSYANTLSASVINPAFADRIDLRGRLQQVWMPRDTSALRSIREETVHFMRLPYLNTGLERYDRVASAYGVELRYPYLAKRLVEFLLAIPPAQIMHDGWQKIVVRRAMAGILTDEVRWRRGFQHLGWPLQQARTRLAADQIRDLMAHDLPLLAPYVDVPKLHSLFEAFKSGQDVDFNNLWIALTLALWLKRQ